MSRGSSGMLADVCVKRTPPGIDPFRGARRTGRAAPARHRAAHGGKLLRNPDVTRVSTGASILTDPAEPGMITGR